MSDNHRVTNPDCPANNGHTEHCQKRLKYGDGGVCCECLQYHLNSRQLPGCCFPDDVEKDFDRSFKAFAKAWSL